MQFLLRRIYPIRELILELDRKCQPVQKANDCVMHFWKALQKIRETNLQTNFSSKQFQGRNFSVKLGQKLYFVQNFREMNPNNNK